MFILLESEVPPPIPAQTDIDRRAACPIAGRYMTPRAHPLHPSIFALLAQRGMATSDWPLPRVTSVAQAGGAARCSSAVAMAADKLLGCGCEAANLLCARAKEEVDHGFKAKREGEEGGKKERRGLPYIFGGVDFMQYLVTEFLTT